jgi:hypothetical protein
MIESWYMDDNSEVDQREPHRKEPNEPCSEETLDKLGMCLLLGIISQPLHSITYDRSVMSSCGYLTQFPEVSCAPKRTLLDAQCIFLAL